MRTNCVRTAVAFAALIMAAAACSASTPQTEGTVQSAEAVEGRLAGPYGVLAAPPLPLSAPNTDLDAPGAIANVDGSVVVHLAGSVLHFVDDNTTDTKPVPAGAELRAVSADGTSAALYRRSADSSSIITVVTRHGHGPDDDGVERFELPGVVEPEAFSTDGGLLYVIDHQVSKVPGAYRVRPLNLETGRLETIVGPTKVPITQDMNGIGRRQVWSPNGTRLNTLYIRQTHHHHDTDEAGAGADSGHTHGTAGTDGFVHILDLSEEWAHCLDLPANFGSGSLATTTLAMSPDGAMLAVADASAGEIAFASTVELVVTRTVPLPAFAIGEELHIGLTEDALVLGSDTTAQWFDISTMEPLGPAKQLSSTLTAFSAGGDTVLAWLDRGGTPTTLRPPAITALTSDS